VTVPPGCVLLPSNIMCCLLCLNSDFNFVPKLQERSQSQLFGLHPTCMAQCAAGVGQVWVVYSRVRWKAGHLQTSCINTPGDVAALNPVGKSVWWWHAALSLASLTCVAFWIVMLQVSQSQKCPAAAHVARHAAAVHSSSLACSIGLLPLAAC